MKNTTTEKLTSGTAIALFTIESESERVSPIIVTFSIFHDFKL